MKKDVRRSPQELWTAAYGLAMLGLYLLYPGTGGYETITAHKWRLYVLLTGGYVLGAAVLHLELTLVGAKKLPAPRAALGALQPAHWAAVAYLLFTALSTAFSPHRATALWGSARREGLAAIALYCLSFLLLSACARPKKWMLWVLCAAMAANCLLCFAQLAGFNPLGLYPPGLTYHDGNKLYAGQFLGTAGNVDILSALLCLAIPALLAAAWRIKELPLRAACLVSGGLCLGVWWGSFVAGGILGVAGAVVLSLPVLTRDKKRRRLLLAAVAALLAAAAAAVYLFGGRMGGFLFEAHELMHGRWEDHYGSGRIYIWRNVLPLVSERPLLGGGPDTLGLRTDAAFERFDEELGILIRSAVDTAHNEYLNIAVNQGLPALAAYLTLLGASAVNWIRKAGADDVAAICGCAVLGYSIQAFFGVSSPITAPFLWMALAFLNPMEISRDTKPVGRKRT